MRRSRFTLPALALVAATLSGCVTGNCTGDPRTDSAMCVAGSLSRGDYDRRLDTMNQQKNAAEYASLQQRVMEQELSAELAEVSRQRRAAESQIETIERQLDEAFRRGLVTTSEIAQLNKQVEALKFELRSISDSQPEAAKNKAKEVRVAAEMLSEALKKRFRGQMVQ